MAHDPIPDPDGDFNAWQANFVTQAIANAVALGLTLPEQTELTTRQTAWGSGFTANNAAQAAAQSAAATKDVRRGSLEQYIRLLMQQFNGLSTMTNALRALLGWTERSGTRTHVGAPTVSPGANVDTSERLRHTINFFDPAHPLSRAKPAGCAGCEIWVKIGGAPPGDLSECTYLATDTRTPYVADYDAAQGGLVAHYILRWVSPRHEPGPLSGTVSATIGA